MRDSETRKVDVHVRTPLTKPSRIATFTAGRESPNDLSAAGIERVDVSIEAAEEDTVPKDCGR